MSKFTILFMTLFFSANIFSAEVRELHLLEVNLAEDEAQALGEAIGLATAVWSREKFEGAGFKIELSVSGWSYENNPKYKYEGKILANLAVLKLTKTTDAYEFSILPASSEKLFNLLKIQEVQENVTDESGEKRLAAVKKLNQGKFSLVCKQYSNPRHECTFTFKQ